MWTIKNVQLDKESCRTYLFLDSILFFYSIHFDSEFATLEHILALVRMSMLCYRHGREKNSKMEINICIVVFKHLFDFYLKSFFNLKNLPFSDPSQDPKSKIS